MTVAVSALKVEFLTGSHASLYSGYISSGDFNGIFTIVNAVSTPPSTLTIGLASAMQLQQQVLAAEYLVLSAGQRELWNAILTTTAARGDISISNPNIRLQIAAVWSAGTTTRSNLSNIQLRACTRAEALGGEGELIPVDAIYYAITSP